MRAIFSAVWLSMQQYPSTAGENLKKETDGQNTQMLEAQQLYAQLWLERFLNQLHERMSDCLLRVTNQQTARESEAEILQTIVNQLSSALKSDSVALALAHQSTGDQPLLEQAYKISYCPTAQEVQSQEVVLAEGNLSLRLGQVFTLEDLQKLQIQQPQAAWSLYEQQSVVGWLIVSMLPLPPDSDSLEALKAQYKPQLVQRSLNAMILALKHSRRLQAAFLQCQHLEAHNRELVGANKLKSEFLANTSHEIRTPLSSILGFTRLLQVQSFSPSNLRHQEYLSIILSSGQHLLALLNDILDLSKIEANQLEVYCESVNVPDVCRSVMALVKEKASGKGLELHLDLDHITTLVADCLRLKQMLFNLLSNAIKFTVKGSVGLQVRHKGAFLHFTVWDTGTGISKEEQAQLFQPYSQIANVVAGRQEGTGLGLALTHKLAELHKGWVEVQSELDRGSKFTVVLPLWGTRGPLWGLGAKEEEGQQGKQGENENFVTFLPPSVRVTAPILLVEDNVHNAKLMTTYLKKLGYQVNWVKNAFYMWQALEGAQPVLILMDVHLPDTDGLTLLQQLQAHEQYRAIPVIVQTAMAMKGDRETCLAAGAIEYISKPIDLNTLATIVSKYSDTRNV